MDVSELQEIETKISDIKKIQSDFFKKKKADRTDADVESLTKARESLKELKDKVKSGYRVLQQTKRKVQTK